MNPNQVTVCTCLPVFIGMLYLGTQSYAYASSAFNSFIGRTYYAYNAHADRYFRASIRFRPRLAELIS
jgi:hypothetical protein